MKFSFLSAVFALFLSTSSAFANITNFFTPDWWKTATLEDVAKELANGTSVKERDEIGQTPLICASWYNQNPEIITTLLKHGADAKAKSNEGKTALDYAKDNPKIYQTEAYWELNQVMYE